MRLSGRVAYDLRKLAHVYNGWPRGTVADAIRRDALSIMKGKRPRGESRMEEVAAFIGDVARDAASLRRLADELLIARQIARQTNRQPAAKEVLA